MIYVEIGVNVPQDRGAFHYHLPPGLENRVQTGHLVVVPFGSQRVQGVVLRTVQQPAVPETRAVESLVDPKPVLTPVQLQFARAIAGQTMASLPASLALMVPPGISQQADSLYSLSSDDLPIGDLTQMQSRLVKLLKRRGALRARQIDRAIPRTDWRSAAQRLVRLGVLNKESVLPPPTVRPRYIRTVQLAAPPAAVLAQMNHVGRAGSAALKRRQSILEFLMREPGPVDASWVYAESGGNANDLRVLADRAMIRLGETQIWRDPLEGLEYVPSARPTLTPDQNEVWEEIQAGLAQARAGEVVAPFLVHGVTASGKTEIYLRATDEVMQSGRQVIMLIPEIALTAQTVRRFMSRFPGTVGLIHSRLSPGERYDTWRRARDGEIGVVIGPRSALFTPLPDLGLIVVDESHDDSYYQSENPPHFHAREAAVLYAQIAGAVCILGSATPDIVSSYRARRGRWRLLKLPARILAHRETIRLQAEKHGLRSHYRPLAGEAQTMDLPPVKLVDMRTELKAGNRSIFSRQLQVSLSAVLENGYQAILFLNRRGTATYIFCRDCGYSMTCPRCGTSLTYHRPKEALTCHHCGYHRKFPVRCPQCKSERIRQYGTGTERVESEVLELFPQARTLRWDWESTRQKGAHEIILGHFAAHRADVLVGTQMLAKGLDLPLVTLVGVVLAEVGLNLPDYRAGERTFQVLTQVAGRAGRSPLGGQVILQTFQPDHYVIQAAARHNFDAFYSQELSYRRQLGYPPFTQLVRLEYRDSRADRAESEAFAMARRIRRWLAADDRRETQIVGPAPCFYARLDGRYRWHIIVRGPDPVSLLRNRALGAWRVEVNPPSLL